MIEPSTMGQIPNILFGVAAIVGALGSSVAAVFGALTHRTMGEVKSQTNGINSKLQAKIDQKDAEITDLKNGGTHP